MKKQKPWRDNANSLLVVYSILAATCGILIVLVFQDLKISEHWWIPIGLFAVSLWLFIFSAESLTDALDEDDVKKYLSILFLYNIAVILLLTGIASIIYIRYIPNANSTCRKIFFTVFVLGINFRWLKHCYWLIFSPKKEYLNYIVELNGDSKPEYERGWTNIFLWFRKINHGREEEITFKGTIIELKPSSIVGIGVFAAKAIITGEVIEEGIREGDYKTLVPWANVELLEYEIKAHIYAYCIGTPEGFFPPPDNDFNQLSVGWYMNHSCSGNIGFDENGDFVAIRTIQKGEELTYDYSLAESNPNFKMTCLCNSENCRKTITGNDWKDENFRAYNLEFMLPRLRKGN